NFVSGKNSVMCLVQGSPSNVVVVYEIATTVGINELSNSNDLIIFPNPAKNNIQINLSNFDDNFNEVIILDISGKAVLSHSISNNDANLNIDVSSLSNGIYTISIISNEQVLHQK